jgi:hypothetical protein
VVGQFMDALDAALAVAKKASAVELVPS